MININDLEDSKVPKWLKILGYIVIIVIGLFGIFQWFYDQNNDDQCGERLSKAREIVMEGRNCTKTLLIKDKGNVNAFEITTCYSLEKRGLNEIEGIVENCKCASDVRKSALKEMILFYECSLEPQKFNSLIEELKSKLKSFK